MRRLNIFVDETGDFGFDNESSELYGVSFTFHEQDDDISNEIKKLNNRLKRIGYTGMMHMAALIMKREDYSGFSIQKRKSLFNAIYQFSRKIPVKYKSIIINKKYADKRLVLRQQLSKEIDQMISSNGFYLMKFDKIVMYYDNGQEILGTVLESLFKRFDGFELKTSFDKKKKRLFQVSDMLTYIDKYDYKYKHKMPFSKSEQYFFNVVDIRKILKELNNKRIN